MTKLMSVAEGKLEEGRINLARDATQTKGQSPCHQSQTNLKILKETSVNNAETLPQRPASFTFRNESVVRPLCHCGKINNKVAKVRRSFLEYVALQLLNYLSVCYHLRKV